MTPPVIETLKVLAGIANTERISPELKKKTETTIEKFLEVINVEAEKMRAANSTIIL